MLRFAKAFLDIALWRKSPAQLPASVLLLCLVAAAAALLEVIGALLPAAPAGEILTRVALAVALAARIRLGGAGHRPAAPAIPADRHRAPRSGGTRGAGALSARHVAEFHRLRGPRLGSPRRAAAGRAHLVFACLREHLAGRPRCAARARCRHQCRLSCCCRWPWSSSCCRSLEHARTHLRDCGDLHGRRGGDRQGRGIPRHRARTSTSIRR